MCIITIFQKHKNYKCRCKRLRKDWEIIHTTCPKKAVSLFADKYNLKYGDIVTIWGCGNFKVLFQKVYYAKKIDTCEK